jgi:hypothetical protein
MLCAKHTLGFTMLFRKWLLECMGKALLMGEYLTDSVNLLPSVFPCIQ